MRQPVAAIAEGSEHEENGTGLLRSYAVPKILGIYDRVKDFNPILKSSLGMVESKILQPVEAAIPVEWKNRALSSGDQLDSMVTKRYIDTKAVVDARVIVPIHNTVDAVNEKVVHPIQNQVHTRIVHPIQETVSHRIVEPYSKVRQLSYQDVKGIVSEKVTEKQLQWTDLRGSLSKKARKRLEDGLQQVTEFSAHRGKDILTIDLIEYSTIVLGNASKTASERMQPTMEMLAHGVEKANEARHSLQRYISENVSKAGKMSAEMREELTIRLHKAMQAARELANSGVVFVREKYAKVEEQYIPEQYHATFENLPPKAQDAVQFILHSPELFSEVTEKADLTTSKGVLANIESLLGAVKHVYYQHSASHVEGSPQLLAVEPIKDLANANKGKKSAKGKAK
jgi:hypothetical protein